MLNPSSYNVAPGNVSSRENQGQQLWQGMSDENQPGEEVSPPTAAQPDARGNVAELLLPIRPNFDVSVRVTDDYGPNSPRPVESSAEKSPQHLDTAAAPESNYSFSSSTTAVLQRAFDLAPCGPRALENFRTSAGRTNCPKPDQKCVLNWMGKIYRRQRQIVIPFIWGILVGITITAVLFQQHVLFRSAMPWPTEGAKSLLAKDFSKNNSKLDGAPINTLKPSTALSVRAVHQHLDHREFPEKSSFSSAEAENQVRLKTRIFVGVITAEKFLSSRSVAVNNTWGTQVDKLEFFAANGSPDKYHVPVVSLDGISDTEYPPQRKMFTMLKHICKHHLDNFEWFIRADDDVYIRVERLRKFLSQIDGDKMIYMGQPGHGVPEVREKLGLNGHNFCMGGPGVLFNRRAMLEMCPHIDHCMEEVVSKEEDVELGRCVTNHLHIECTHAWEKLFRNNKTIQELPLFLKKLYTPPYKAGRSPIEDQWWTLKLFYHSYQEEYTEEKPFLGNLAENDHVSRALTLHHIKVPYIMYRVHRHYTSLLLNSTTQEISAIGKDLERTNVVLPLEQQRFLTMEKTLVPEYKPQTLRQVNAWQSFEVDSMYNLAPSDVTHDITNDMLADLKQVGETGIDESIGHPQQSKFTYSHVSDGYLRSDPHRGTDYLLDVYFSSKQRDVPDQDNDGRWFPHDLIRRVRLLRPAGELEVTGVRDLPSNQFDQKPQGHFYVIVPVHSSQSSLFESFMRNHYEPSFLLPQVNEHATLIAVAVDDRDAAKQSYVSGPSADEIAKWYKLKYPTADIVSVPGGSMQGDVDALTQGAYADGVVRALGLASDDKGAPPYALLTSPNVSLSAHAFVSCLRRTGPVPDSYSNYNFLDYRGKGQARNSTPLLYQPVPFRVFPAATLAPSDDKGSDRLPSLRVQSAVGFWDAYAATGEDGNAVLAPLCGKLHDFETAARDAVAQRNSTTATGFRQLLFNQVYAGALGVIRTPDRAFVNHRKR